MQNQQSRAAEAQPAHDFSGQLVLVTGASRGIGEGCARALAAAGAEVVNAVRFLASPQASPIMGTSLLVDGSYTTR